MESPDTESNLLKNEFQTQELSDGEDDDFDCEKMRRDYIQKLKNITRRSSTLILNFYTSFTMRYPDGRVGKEDFIENIVFKIIVESENYENFSSQNDEELKKEKRKLCERLFEICDQDHNGRVDFLEYFTLFWSRSEGSAYEKLSLIFDMYDLNSSGKIDFNELHTIVKTLLKLKYSNEAFGESTGDQKVNEKQLMQFQKSILKDNVITNAKLPLSYNIAMYIMVKLDTNRSGNLTRTEFVNGCLNNENVKKFLTPLKVFL